MRKTFLGSALLLLSLSVPGQQHMSDKTFDMLRGRVAKVVTETATLTNESGNWIEGKHLPISSVTYDESGNLLKRESYWKGTLMSISEYFFLDGSRVEKFTELQPPNGGGGVGPGPKAPRDPRYTLKFVYKYDSKGNRTEELRYGNDTSLSSRDVNVYDDRGNKIESTTYIRDARQPSRRTVYGYDDRGYVVDEADHIGTNLVMKTSYTYEFDSNGNWIKRTGIYELARDGKPKSQSRFVEYRTITYFQD